MPEKKTKKKKFKKVVEWDLVSGWWSYLILTPLFFPIILIWSIIEAIYRVFKGLHWNEFREVYYVEVE